MSVRIATFNVENLMARFDFSHWRKQKAVGLPDKDDETFQRLALEDAARNMTAQAFGDCDADILCLQEVEDRATLDAFVKNYVEPITGQKYPQRVVIEGNDTRGIDVGLLAKEKSADGETLDIRKIKSHHKRSFGELGVYTDELKARGVHPNERVFRRDCLEVNIKVGGRPVTLFLSHFKSMGSGKDNGNGRLYTKPVRQAEAQAVRNIIEHKFGAKRARKMRWLICGDLNDYTERLVITGDEERGYDFTYSPDADTALHPLFDDGFSIDLLKRRVQDDRWTLHFARSPDDEPHQNPSSGLRHLVQLDYILASPALAENNKNVLPSVIRNGLPLRTVFPPHQDVDRYAGTGWDRPKASDHCPVVATLKIV